MTKIFLCQRAGEFRLSIIIDGQERLFVKAVGEENFLSEVEVKINDRNIKDFPQIQNSVRCSKTNDFQVTSNGCNPVSEDLKQKVRRIFNEVSEPSLI